MGSQRVLHRPPHRRMEGDLPRFASLPVTDAHGARAGLQREVRRGEGCHCSHPQPGLEHTRDEGHMAPGQLMRRGGGRVEQGAHLVAWQRERRRRAGLAHAPQRRRWVFGPPVAVTQPPQQQTQALQASVPRGRWGPLFRHQMRPKRRYVHGAALGQQGGLLLMHPRQPRAKARQIAQRGVDGSRREVAVGEMVAKRVKERGRGGRTGCRYSPQNVTSVRAHLFGVSYVQRAADSPGKATYTHHPGGEKQVSPHDRLEAKGPSVQSGP